MGRLSKDLQTVERTFDRMERLLDGPEDRLRRHTPVSGWSAAEQLHHVLIANRWALTSVVSILRGHGQFPDSGRLTLLGAVVLGFGRIPRGRGKAPATSQPDADATIAELRTQLRKQRGYLATIKNEAGRVAALRGRFLHPYFGDLSASDGIRFVRVHTDHHLRIVDDILGYPES